MTKKEAVQVVQAPVVVTPALPIIPLGERILVELIAAEDTRGGIVLPEAAKKVDRAIVRAIGLGVPTSIVYDRKRDLQGCEVRGIQVGDKVTLPRGPAMGEAYNKNGVMYLLVNYTHISGIIP